MDTLLTDARPKARKDHRCDAWHWIEMGAPFDWLTFAEKREIIKAKRNGYVIKKGDVYVRQSGLYEGEIITFKAIPGLHQICLDYGLYENV